jgi:hypothetical protein
VAEPITALSWMLCSCWEGERVLNAEVSGADVNAPKTDPDVEAVGSGAGDCVDDGRPQSVACCAHRVLTSRPGRLVRATASPISRRIMERAAGTA